MNGANKKPVFIINGPNLNLLGTRDTDVYGTQTLEDLKSALEDQAKGLGLNIDFRQSNQEGDLVDWCQEAEQSALGLIINGGGYTHTSVSLRDALEPLTIPVVEVHLSNIYAREEFRQKSLLSGLVKGVVAGFGAAGYHFALEEIARNLT